MGKILSIKNTFERQFSMGKKNPKLRKALYLTSKNST